jgi:hypothetical protein
MKDFLAQFVPGPKAVAAAVTPLLLFIDHKLKLGIPDAKVVAVSLPLAAYIVGHFFKGKDNA